MREGVAAALPPATPGGVSRVRPGSHAADNGAAGTARAGRSGAGVGVRSGPGSGCWRGRRGAERCEDINGEGEAGGARGR